MLSKLRDGVFTINPELTSAHLATVDAVRFMLGQIEATDSPGDRDFSALVSVLTRLNDGETGLSATPAPAAAAPVLAATPAPEIVPIPLQPKLVAVAA